MPTRTITRELCDVCFNEQPAREVEATEHIRFSWQGTPYVLLACGEHARPVRAQLEAWADIATPSRSGGSGRSRGSGQRSSAAGAATLFSRLSPEEKVRFRKWANLPSARRIADQRVQQWLDAGQP